MRIAVYALSGVPQNIRRNLGNEKSLYLDMFFNAHHNPGQYSLC